MLFIHHFGLHPEVLGSARKFEFLAGFTLFLEVDNVVVHLIELFFIGLPVVSLQRIAHGDVVLFGLTKFAHEFLELDRFFLVLLDFAFDV